MKYAHDQSMLNRTRVKFASNCKEARKGGGRHQRSKSGATPGGKSSKRRKDKYLSNLRRDTADYDVEDNIGGEVSDYAGDSDSNELGSSSSQARS